MARGSEDYTQSTTSGFDSWESDIFDVSKSAEIGLEIVIASTGTSDPKVKLMGAISCAHGFGYIRDSDQVPIEISLSETTNIRNIYAPNVHLIKIVGSANGVGSGNLTNITIER